jgi:hypothetical protein
MANPLPGLATAAAGAMGREADGPADRSRILLRSSLSGTGGGAKRSSDMSVDGRDERFARSCV